MTDTTVLAYIPSPSQGVWYLGPLPIRAYALFIIVGIIIAVWWGDRRWRARGGRPQEVLDVAIWAVPFGLVGGRLYHLATDWRTYFGDGPKQPIDALKVWDGGLGIWGAVLLGGVGAWIATRRMGIKLPPFADAIAPPILLAQAIGRLGNYFNQELYGRETSLPWGLKIYDRIDKSGNVDPSLIDGHSTGHVVAIVQPTFLYELIWNVLIVIALVLLDRTGRIGHGRLFALYVAGYCAGRFFVELLRADHATHVFGIRINLFTAAIVFACAVVYFLLAPRGRETRDEVHRHPEIDQDAAAYDSDGDPLDDDEFGDEDFDDDDRGDVDLSDEDPGHDDLDQDDLDGDTLDGEDLSDEDLSDEDPAEEDLDGRDQERPDTAAQTESEGASGRRS
ncbi:hypothetical protein GCM10027169_10840 [Gordonia jinhuaensis]|uniref:Phosphatidylglycerol--prolipoprotein diacylglyceryl transferase n=1 Tax=Gordonia jinhuaensis TaxID=1517702 RepID=A0A916WQ46_9ACTN|nr:prolipoprotein diacylglyceryl transferase [Gordonia jinhuaensis]GGB19863.1 hypothetical protein GCM10011489_05000 [Gordonia jinhuaensis]